MFLRRIYTQIKVAESCYPFLVISSIEDGFQRWGQLPLGIAALFFEVMSLQGNTAMLVEISSIFFGNIAAEMCSTTLLPVFDVNATYKHVFIHPIL